MRSWNFLLPSLDPRHDRALRVATPVASAMMFSWVIGLPAGAPDLALDMAFAHHQHPVADAR